MEKKTTDQFFDLLCKMQNYYIANLMKADSYRMFLAEKLQQQEMEISQISEIMRQLLHSRITQVSPNEC